MARPIWLELLPTSEQHDDIRLTFGSSTRTEDSYYFAKDPEFMPGDESVSKTALVLKKLLIQWLQRLGSSETCYLPCGFSDQHVTWIRCCTAATVVNISLGWSEDEGWQFIPTNVGDREPKSFEEFDDVQALHVYRPRLLAAIRSNLLAFGS